MEVVMANHDRSLIPASIARDSGDQGLFLVVGAVIVMTLIGVYLAIGAPGLHMQVANAPMQVTSDR
jgi:hypothetical protein